MFKVCAYLTKRSDITTDAFIDYLRRGDRAGLG